MAAKARDILKQYFETGDYPTEAQFADFIDSFLQVGEAIPVSQVTGLQMLLNSFYSKVQIDALLGALLPITGSANGVVEIPFANRTLVREVEILGPNQGYIKAGMAADNDDFGSDDYYPNGITVLVLNKAFKAGESLFLTTTNAIDFIIRKA